MPTPMISEQWPRFLLPIVRKEWFQHMTAVPSPVAGLYNESTSETAVEYSQGIGDFGLIPEYNSSTAEGAPAAIQYGSFNPLYETTFVHKEYAKGLAIERKLWDDLRTSEIKTRAANLGNSYGSTLAVFQSSVFNNAFSTSYKGADGVALCSANHPTSPTNSTVISNYGTAALSYAAINAVQAAGFALKADDGTPMPVIYDTLLVPGALYSKALEETKGAFVPGHADLTASALANQAQFNIIRDPYLTDVNNWFMVSSTLAKLHLLWFWRVQPEMSMDPASDFNLVAKYRTYMRMSAGFDDWRWVWGNEVA